MKKILTLILLLSSVATYAQQTETAAESKYGPFLTNKFFDNWFLSVGGGAQVFFGEFDGELGLGDRIAPAFDVSLGKWITPAIGLRGQFAGLKVKGAVMGLQGRYREGATGTANLYEENFSMFNLHGDLLWNISNTIAGYNPSRFWSFVPFAGVGYARSWKEDVNPVVKEVGFSTGLLNKLRLSDAVDLNLELRALLVNERFDGLEIGEGIEELTSATIGFTYNFKKRGFDRPEKPIVPDYTPYTSKISDLEKQIAAADAAAKKLASDLSAEKNKKPQTITKTEYVVAPMAVWFPINGTKLTDKDLINLGNYAETIKKSGNKFKILGSADKATGSKKINQKLSEGRASAVYDALVNKFGVDPSKLEVIAKGDENEPFDKPVLNRVVILE
ncbi:MAG: OmpA family protein [Bacteroidales bacterium]|nr:OmpA family protein [Bacteroidales bacterium]MDD4639650.1 OmpA family protein [Bacteroidales bacterium]